MTAEPTPVPPDALHRELTSERIQSARRMNLLRFLGVSAFFALFLVLGGILGLPAWTGNLDLFAVYWAIATAVFWVSRRFPPVGSAASRLTVICSCSGEAQTPSPPRSLEAVRLASLAARVAAQKQGDTGEELHAMDYLVYAYLQSGREQDAAQVIQQLKTMKNLRAGDFKIGPGSDPR